METDDVAERERTLERGYALGGRGLVVVEELTRERWVAIGLDLASRDVATQWALGDWVGLHRGEWGATYEAAMAVTGLSYQQVSRLARTSEIFPEPERWRDVKWSHYSIVAEITSMPHEDMTAWLVRAEGERLTVAAMTALIAEAREAAGTRRHPVAKRTGGGPRRVRSATHVECPQCRHVFPIADHRVRPKVGRPRKTNATSEI